MIRTTLATVGAALLLLPVIVGCQQPAPNNTKIDVTIPRPGPRPITPVVVPVIPVRPIIIEPHHPHRGGGHGDEVEAGQLLKKKPDADSGGPLKPFINAAENDLAKFGGAIEAAYWSGAKDGAVVVAVLLVVGYLLTQRRRASA